MANTGIVGIVTPIISSHGRTSNYGIIDVNTALRVGGAIVAALLICAIVAFVSSRQNWFTKFDCWFIPKVIIVALLLAAILIGITLLIAQL